MWYILNSIFRQSISSYITQTQFSLNFASSSGQRRDVTCAEWDGRCTNGLAACLTLTDQGTPGPHLVISFPHSWSLSRWLYRETRAMINLCSIAERWRGNMFFVQADFYKWRSSTSSWLKTSDEKYRRMKTFDIRRSRESVENYEKCYR